MCHGSWGMRVQEASCHFSLKSKVASLFKGVAGLDLSNCTGKSSNKFCQVLFSYCFLLSIERFTFFLKSFFLSY